MCAKRMLVAIAVIAVGATAGAVLSQVRPPQEVCSKSLETLTSSAEKIEKYIADVIASFEGGDELPPRELARRQCNVWGDLDTLASELLTHIEQTKDLFVACWGQQWYDGQHAFWARNASGYRASLEGCDSLQD